MMSDGLKPWVSVFRLSFSTCIQHSICYIDEEQLNIAIEVNDDGCDMPDYARYACQVFIGGHEGSVGCSPTGVMFNKFMTLLYQDIRRTRGVDSSLPHCWYR